MTVEITDKFSSWHKISYNEIFTKENEIREEYENILTFFQSQTVERLRSIKKRIDFVLREQGITFGEFRADGYIERAWYLDMIPHIITEKEFEKVKKGIEQRLVGLNLFLKDIYSEQKILKSGKIPLSLILGDMNYLRDCVGVSVPNDVYLHVGAFDLVKSSDGEFRIIDDNVSIPSGVSYALANRQVLRQQFPNLFNKLEIRQIWDTTSVMLSKLKECAPRQVENPSVVLLSPGIYNEAYSEHELLASRMGIPLALPKDLVVKENFLYIKTVYGLSKVDVLYRRIQDFFIDPVSFYQDSVLGVSGLLSCVRHGNVTVANAIGCGVASSKALLPYIDTIIEFYLNEKPILETIPTFLLSDSKVIEYVFQNINNYVIKPVQGTGGNGLIIGRETSNKEIQEFKEKVKNNSTAYIAQPVVSLSTSKVFSPEGLKERYVETRFFSFLGSSFYLSNCALTRVSPNNNTLMVTNSKGGGSKDTWIMGKSDKFASHFVITGTNSVSKNFLLSRVAESLFWLGRYVNRAFKIANVLQVTYSSEIDILLGKESGSYKTITRTISRLTGGPLKKFMKVNASNWQESFFHYSVSDKSNPYSVQSNLNFAMSNAREIQNMLSDDMWVSLKKLSEYMNNLPGKGEYSNSVEDLTEWLYGVIHYSQSFYGAALDSSSKASIMQFVQLGRLLEHCNSIFQVIRSTITYLIQVKDDEESYYNNQPFIIVILKVLNSYEAFQWNYESRFEPYLAYRMLLTDRSFGSSFVSSLQKIKGFLQEYSIDKRYNENSPEHVCDILTSRVESFDLLRQIGSKEMIEKSEIQKSKFFTPKEKILPGLWASDLRMGLDYLGDLIIDRYSHLHFSNPFTKENT
ncbi:MAG: circularly permuted type 2 ATP-grasp protein [Leptospiraceae bacterium]|nr:circularly permuted type 2 ATP-grasp protein [Leptospiraceae bacterium]